MANGPELHTAGAKDAHLHTWFQRRGQNPTIRPRDDQFEGRRVQKGVILSPSFEVHHLPAYLNCNSNVRQNQTLDPCHADEWAAAAELTSLRYVRPSYRLLRPRCRENLYPAGTSHFPRPWAGHVRRAARPFGYFGYIGKGNEKRWSRFSATLCVYQLIRCYSFTQRTGQLDAKYLLSSNFTSLRVFG